jgi:hypothetical protein
VSRERPHWIGVESATHTVSLHRSVSLASARTKYLSSGNAARSRLLQLGLAFQFAGGRPGRRRADDLEAAAVEGVHGRAGGVGLAGAGVADHQGDPGALLGDLPHHRRLVGVEAVAFGQGSADVLAGDDRGAFAGAAFGLLHQAPLQRQQLGVA